MKYKELKRLFKMAKKLMPYASDVDVFIEIGIFLKKTEGYTQPVPY